jgi:hypothetical protein
MNTLQEVNVAINSTSGHYVKKAKQVICLDKITESFVVEGDSILTTKNHTTLELLGGCLITPQKVYNPYLKMFEKSKD